MFGPIRTLCIAAALYLPLSLFVWFAFAGFMVTPVLWLSKAVLLSWMPEIFVDSQRNQHTFNVLSSLVAQTEPGKQLVVDFMINPMIYGYGLPVIAGLALATPNSIGTRWRQIAIGAAVIWLVQLNGVIWDVLQYVNTGLDGGVAAIAKHHLSPTFLALMYQFGYLILPPLTPVLLWALMNRKFIDNLIQLDHIQSYEEADETSVPGKNGAAP